MRTLTRPENTTFRVSRGDDDDLLPLAGRLPTPIPDRERDDEVDSEAFDPLDHARRYAGVDIGSETPSEQEQKLVKMAYERVQESSIARKVHAEEYLTCLNFWNGNQWGAWADGCWNDYRQLDDTNRVYSVVNRIRSAVRKHIARALSARTSISISPFSGRKADLLSARQARSIASHLEYVNNDLQTMLHARLMAHAFGPVINYSYVDTDTVVPMPDYSDIDEDGDFGIMDVKAGEVCSENISWENFYPDPKATYDIDEDAEWVATCVRRSTNTVRMRWPEAGKYAEQESGPSQANSLNYRIDSMVGNRSTATTSGMKFVNVITLWEQPSDLYPDGLYLVVAGNRVMAVRDWPYKTLKHPTRAKRYRFPYTMLSFQRGIDTLWGDNAVSPAIGMQREINRLISRIAERTKQGDRKILVARGSNIEANAFKSGKPDEVVYYTQDAETGGEKPVDMPTPPMDPSTIQLLQEMFRQIDIQMEVLDIDRGQAPSPDSSGRAIDALQGASNSTASLFTEAVRVFTESYTWKRLKLTEELYDVPRMIYLQDTASSTPADATPPQQQPPDPVSGQSPMGAIPPAQMGSSPAQGIPGQAPPMAPPSVNVPGQMATSPDFSQTADAIKAILFQQQMEPVPGQALAPDEDAPKAQAEDFSKFAKGRWVLSVSVSSVKTPQAREQMIMDWYKAGAFLPEAIPTTIILLQLLEIEEADKLTTDLLVALKQIQKREDELNQQAQQAEQDAIDKKAQAQSQLQQQKAQSDAALAQQKAQFDKEQEAASAEGKIAVLGAQSDAEMKKIVTQHGVDLHHATHEHLLGQAAADTANQANLTAQAHQSALSRSEAEAQARSEAEASAKTEKKK